MMLLQNLGFQCFLLGAFFWWHLTPSRLVPETFRGRFVAYRRAYWCVMVPYLLFFALPVILVMTS
jgi:hypothetical protein